MPDSPVSELRQQIEALKPWAALASSSPVRQMGRIKRLAEEARSTIDLVKDRAISILAVYLGRQDDAYVARLSREISELKPARVIEDRSQPSLLAIVGLGPSHIAIESEERLAAARSAFQTAERLCELITHATDHIEQADKSGWSTRPRRQGTVFIGHGRSQQWRDLRDFVRDELRLPWDEFNRVAVAGTTTVERLLQMLDHASMALMVLTAEDEKVDGNWLARQNVVHEAGLFQGRLGFARAIVLMEEGCAEFSNIAGLGQIRFPTGNIAASFEEVRRVLQREELLG